MTASRYFTRAGILLAAFAAIVGVFFIGVRPWYLRWGATDEEIRRALPGDEIIPGAAFQETRAITIHAPSAIVWKWTAQIGQDRGGFYSYDFLENLVGCEMPTTDVLRPDRQAWQLGDKLWMYPANKAGGAGFATLRAFVPGKALGFGTHAFGTPPGEPEDGSWSYVVERIDDSTSRFIARGRGAAGRSLLGVAFDHSIFEPVHFAMERRMMIGLKQLAEGRDRERAMNHLMVALWTIVFLLVGMAKLAVLFRDDWRVPLVGFVAACALFAYLTLVQPPFVAGVLGILAVASILLLRLPLRVSGDFGVLRPPALRD